MEVVKQKIREINDKKNAKDRSDRPTAVEEDMLVTLEVCYEFYLRGFTFARMDIQRSHAVNFLVDEERGALIPPFTSVAGLGETVVLGYHGKAKGKNLYLHRRIFLGLYEGIQHPSGAAQRGGSLWRYAGQ